MQDFVPAPHRRIHCAKHLSWPALGFVALLMLVPVATYGQQPATGPAPDAEAQGSAPDRRHCALEREIPAGEAHQAAAADEKHYYAITSSSVAKYDRASGDRIASSTGEAMHLNSGFMHEGKLLLAHSNYPLTPEKSEIKQLDPTTMQLTTYRDLGDAGGSLTWVVRHQGAWWCNFAKYGKDNNQTALVQYNDDWKELRRFAYPEQVISQLGSMSISGGVFVGDRLFATGHDDPIIFVLSLPTTGDKLVLEETLDCPFTGQGIAVDAATSELVGIHRKDRKILIAKLPASEELPVTLRVLSYNIHHGEGVDGKLDLARIAAIIDEAKPDLVFLQEVDQKVERSQKIDEPAVLAEATKMHVCFGSNLALQGGGYGNAILSRYKIERFDNHLLPTVDQGEQRGVLVAEVVLPGRKQNLRIAATHFDYRRADEERLASVAWLREKLVKDSAVPTILAGDLNATRESNTLKKLMEDWKIAGDEEAPTIPVENPQRQIDFVLVRPAAVWEIVEVQVLNEPVASDHLPILAVIKLRGQTAEQR